MTRPSRFHHLPSPSRAADPSPVHRRTRGDRVHSLLPCIVPDARAAPGGAARSRAAGSVRSSRRWRSASKQRTAAATLTLSDSAPADHGDRHRARRGRLRAPPRSRPGGLVAEHQGHRAAPVERRSSRSRRRTSVPTVGHAQRPDRSPPTAASPPTTTGTWNSEPAEARTVLGLVGSTVPSQHTTASAPDRRRPSGSSCRRCPDHGRRRRPRPSTHPLGPPDGPGRIPPRPPPAGV